MSGKDGVPKLSKGMSKEITKVLSPMGNEKSSLVAKEVTIGSFKVGLGGFRVNEGMSKLAVESLAFVIIPFVHGIVTNPLGRGSKVSGMRERLEGYFPNDG